MSTAMTSESTQEQRASFRPPIEKCITKDCPNPEKTRGLCGTCYAAAGKAIRQGPVTWKWLEEQGLAKPTIKERAKPVGLFGNQLADAMKVSPPPIAPPNEPAPVLPAADPPAQTPVWAAHVDPAVRAAQAALDGPQPAVAQPCLPPPGFAPVDPTTGQPYLQPLPPQAPIDPCLRRPGPPTALPPINPNTGQPYESLPMPFAPTPAPATMQPSASTANVPAALTIGPPVAAQSTPAAPLLPWEAPASENDTPS